MISFKMDQGLEARAKDARDLVNSQINGRMCVTQCVHMMYVLKEMLGHSCGTYLEIGTLHGGTMGLVMQLAFKSKFVGIDIFSYYGNPIDPGSGVAVTKENTEANIRNLNPHGLDFELIQGSSRDEAIIKRVHEKYPSVDLMLIDGDHSKEGALADFHNYGSLIRSGGILVFDNYNDPGWRGVTEAVDSLDWSGWELIGVVDIMVILKRR